MANNSKTVYLTQEGLDELKKELDNLINVKRPENIQSIKGYNPSSFIKLES